MSVAIEVPPKKWTRAENPFAFMVEYQHPQKPGGVKLAYQGSKLIGITAGPGLEPHDIETLTKKIARELLESAGVVPGRAIMFSTYRVTGSFHYPDRLRITPVPAHAPQPPPLKPYQEREPRYPFVVEFPITRSVNSFIEYHRLERETRKQALLLNVFLEGEIQRPNRGKWQWVDDGSSPRQDICRFLREEYRYPDFADLGVDLFARETDPIPTMDFHEYFYRQNAARKNRCRSASATQSSEMSVVWYDRDHEAVTARGQGDGEGKLGYGVSQCEEAIRLAEIAIEKGETR